MGSEIEKERQQRNKVKSVENVLEKKFGKKISLKTVGKGASNKGSEKLDKMLSVDNVKQLMDAMPKYNVGGHSVMGSPISVDADGETLTNPSAKGYYKGMLVED